MYLGITAEEPNEDYEQPDLGDNIYTEIEYEPPVPGYVGFDLNMG